MSRNKKPTRDPNAAVGYLRTSTISPALKRENLRGQLRVIKKRATTNGLVLTDVYTEGGSGGSVRSRPVLEQMLDDVVREDSTVSIILIEAKTRLARNAAEFEVLERYLGMAGVVVVAAE